jgi:hypothetical protein
MGIPRINGCSMGMEHDYTMPEFALLQDVDLCSHVPGIFKLWQADWMACFEYGTYWIL